MLKERDLKVFCPIVECWRHKERINRCLSRLPKFILVLCERMHTFGMLCSSCTSRWDDTEEMYIACCAPPGVTCALCLQLWENYKWLADLLLIMMQHRCFISGLVVSLLVAT
jgi:predicted amidophosphoribosyltransferase